MGGSRYRRLYSRYMLHEKLYYSKTSDVLRIEYCIKMSILYKFVVHKKTKYFILQILLSKFCWKCEMFNLYRNQSLLYCDFHGCYFNKLESSKWNSLLSVSTFWTVCLLYTNIFRTFKGDFPMSFKKFFDNKISFERKILPT